MTIDLDKLEQLARAATPGPCAPGRTCTDGCWQNEPACLRQEVVDARFIAAANPAAVLELVERLRAAKTENLQLRAAGASLNETIAKSAPRLQDAIDRMHTAEAIVRDLAACHQIYGEGYEGCPLCKASYLWDSELETTICEHTEPCPYRRAVEATKP